ncbi:MAG: DUF2934 domain-containing protein [Fimbriimonadaceae bacterium]
MDKSFIQAESANAKRILAIRKTGAVFVLTDTLIYELCTDSKSAIWPSVQKKLFHVADAIEVWHHTSHLLKHEIEKHKPVAEPVDHHATEGMREWFKGGQVYVPANLEELKSSHEQLREKEVVDDLIIDCQRFCERVPEHIEKLHRNCAGVESIVRMKEWLRHQIIKEHGNADDLEQYIRGAEDSLGPEWFAYHFQRGVLALYGVYILKYGLKNQPGKDFVHTKLDSDYLTLLHYADALATNETSGSLSDMCRWVHGDSRVVFSTHDIDRVMPIENEVRIKAYLRWESQGWPAGEANEDWYWAEEQIYDDLWQKLEQNGAETNLV